MQTEVANAFNHLASNIGMVHDGQELSDETMLDKAGVTDGSKIEVRGEHCPLRLYVGCICRTRALLYPLR